MIILDIFQKFENWANGIHWLVYLTGRINNAAGLHLPPLYVLLSILTLSPITIIPLVKGIAYLILYITRYRIQGKETTGRFATHREVFKNFTLPTFTERTIIYSVTGIAALYAVFYLTGITGAFPIKFFLLLSFLTGWALWRPLRGSANWKTATSPYLLGRYAYIGKDNRCRTSLFGRKLYLFGTRKWLPLRGLTKSYRQEHILVIGKTGSGKTSAYFIPQLIDDAFTNSSTFLIEAKTDDSDLFRMAGPIWQSQGKRVVVFDPWTGGPSASFNPLLHLKADFEDVDTRNAIDRIVDAIYRTTFEQEGVASADAMHHLSKEQNLMKGLIYVTLFRSAPQRNFSMIHEVTNGTIDKCTSYIRSTVRLGDARLSDDIEKTLSWFTSEENLRQESKAETLQGIAKKLAIFSHPAVKAVTLKNEIDMDSFFKTPTLFVIKSPLDTPGASTISSIITRLLMLKGQNKTKLNPDKTFKAWFYLDELPSLCIPNFPQFAATARSNGIGLIVAIQDKADLMTSVRARMGQNSPESLLTNLTTKVILPGCQFETAKYFSQSFGMKEVTSREVQRDVWDVFNFRYRSANQTAELLTPDTIRYMHPDFALIDMSNMRPFFVKKVYGYKTSYYRNWIDWAKKQDIRLDLTPCEEIKYASYKYGYKLAGQGAREAKGRDIGDYLDEDSPFSPSAGEETKPSEEAEKKGEADSVNPFQLLDDEHYHKDDKGE